MDTKKSQIARKIYCCKTCTYNTVRSNDYKKHLITAKHNKDTNRIHNVANIADIIDITNEKFKCECGKKYKYSQGLSKHTKKCNIKTEAAKIDSNMIIDIIKENQEIKNLLIHQNNQVIELYKENSKLIEKLVSNPPSNIMTNSTNHSNNNNSHFNINVFLNEKCKDAINFSDFIDNVEVTNEHLENNAQQGFVKGITKIIMDGLNDLSIFERPIHCSDVKREVMYIKDDDKWEKEEDNKKMREAIQEITRKSLLQFQEWKQENPECNDLDSDAGVKYTAISMNSMAGSKRDEFYPKIIKAVAKETVIDRKESL
jgi:hypothetical protein